MTDGQASIVFNDGKDPEALRTIGEVAQALDIRQHVLRYWEEQFPMLKPLKRAGGRRYYRAEDVALVAEINRLLYGEGFTIRGARQALSGKGRAAPVPVEPAPERPGEELERPGGPSPGNAASQIREVRDALSRALHES